MTSAPTVDPREQGAGIGRALMEVVLARAAAAALAVGEYREPRGAWLPSLLY